ncbi:MAG: CatB-related O-acetyltransferase [Oscillospiraceae bacterium]|nr:CatB-related O-acetyltransferase [Oscillospiraceae bacterium]
MSRKIKHCLCKLLLCNKSNIYLGKNSTFGRGTIFYAPNKTVIGKNVYIGKYCTLEADIEIADNVLLGNNIGLIGKYDHDYSVIGKSIKDSPQIRDKSYKFKGLGKKIIIDSDTWIGYGSIVVSGVHINRGAIVAAGSVVLHDVEPYTIVAGNPAKVIGYRFTDEQIEQHERMLYGGVRY